MVKHLVLISAGFDSRIDEPLGPFRLSDDDFADSTAILLEIAGEHAGSRLMSVLEGGYNLERPRIGRDRAREGTGARVAPVGPLVPVGGLQAGLTSPEG